MATLREIRRKLHSVQNIQKITQAMEMVAASRLRKAQAKAEMSRPYFAQLEDILHQLISEARDFSHPLIDKRSVKKIGFVIVAGDRGLCGGYNHNVFSTTEKVLKKYQPSQVELFLIGRKAIDYFSGKNLKIRKKISDWGGKITFTRLQELTQSLIEYYLNGEFDEIWLIYTHYLSISARVVKIEKLLNIEFAQDGNKKENLSSNTIFEPSIPEIFAEILPRYCIAKIQSALNESYASELAARIFSMRAATKNADEMIEKLTLVRNKVRQSGITRELLEISACVESLK